MKKIIQYRTNKPSPKDALSLVYQLKIGSLNWWIQVIDALWQQTVVRYFFTAATATVVDVFVFWFTYNKLLHQHTTITLYGTLLSPPTISLICGFGCGLVTNFTLTKLLVFNISEDKTRWQLMRFILVNLLVLISNYYLLWFLKAGLGWYATVARAVSAITIGIFSFTAHKFFSFKL